MEEVIVVRKGEKMKTTLLKGMRYDLLLRTETLGAILCTFEPGASMGGPYKHMGQEVHVFLEGEIEYEIEGKTYLLKKGDILCFPSMLPHTVRNPGKEKAVFFSVNVPPTFM